MQPTATDDRPAPLKGPKIVLAAYDLALELIPAVRSFPRSQQFMLGQRIQETVLDVLTGLVAANTARRKEEPLVAVDADVEKLRLLGRLAFDLKFIGVKRYGMLAERIDELGRMLGGWMKWSRKDRGSDRPADRTGDES